MKLEDYISFGSKAFDLFKDCIIMVNPSLKINYLNRSACGLLQYDADELVKKSTHRISKELTKLVKNPMNVDIKALRKIAQAEISFTSKHGIIFRALTYILTLEDNAANVGFTIVFSNPFDTEDNPPHFNQRISLINALNIRLDEFCYIADITIGRNVFVSKSSEKFVGWKVKDLMSAAFAISKQHPDDVWLINDFYKKRERWFKYPGKYDHVAVHYKYRMMHKNGYYVHLKISIMLLERDENGTPKYTICFGKTYQPKKELDTKNFPAITTREKEVLQLLANGNSYKMVASQLNISIDSVRTYVRRMYEKLQVHSVTEAIHKTFHK